MNNDLYFILVCSRLMVSHIAHSKIWIDLMCAGVKESEATEGESDTALQREMEVVVQC